MREYLFLCMLALHALPLGCVKLNILGLGEGFQAAGIHWLAHAQRSLPAFFSGSCLTCSFCCFLLSLKQDSGLLHPLHAPGTLRLQSGRRIIVPNALIGKLWMIPDSVSQIYHTLPAANRCYFTITLGYLQLAVQCSKSHSSIAKPMQQASCKQTGFAHNADQDYLFQLQLLSGLGLGACSRPQRAHQPRTTQQVAHQEIVSPFSGLCTVCRCNTMLHMCTSTVTLLNKVTAYQYQLQIRREIDAC